MLLITLVVVVAAAATLPKGCKRRSVLIVSSNEVSKTPPVFVVPGEVYEMHGGGLKPNTIRKMYTYSSLIRLFAYALVLWLIHFKITFIALHQDVETSWR